MNIRNLPGVLEIRFMERGVCPIAVHY